jgi:hypothetical protein
VLKAQEAGHYGLALFCASGWGPTTLSIPLALPNRASLRQQVALEPILGPLEALEALTCVWITPREARLYDLAEGQPRLLERARATLRGDLTAEATAALLRWGRQRPSRVLVFLGEPAQTHALLRSLGEPGRQQTLALLPPQQVPADPGFLSWLLEALQEEHRLPPRAWPQEALHRLQVGAAGVLVGAPQVWRALAQGPGTLQAVLLGEEAPIEGWRCEGCQAWGPAPVPPACLSCGAAVDRGCVRAALARRAQEVGAPVTWLEPGHALLGWGSALALAAVEQPAHADQEQARQRR